MAVALVVERDIAQMIIIKKTTATASRFLGLDFERPWRHTIQRLSVPRRVGDNENGAVLYHVVFRF
jgi:hypothetical protein